MFKILTGVFYIYKGIIKKYEDSENALGELSGARIIRCSSWW